jgi:hypothetical protein
MQAAALKDGIKSRSLLDTAVLIDTPDLDGKIQKYQHKA